MVSYEHRFNEIHNEDNVLILIVVEDGLVQSLYILMDSWDACLNPYCSGRWSRTHSAMSASQLEAAVLILIVVEDGLVPNWSFSFL